MYKNKKILHIGANKTASTTLQRCLFSKLENITYFGEDCLNFENYRPLFDSLVSDDDIYFKKHRLDCKKIFLNQDNSSNNKIFLYSNEDIMTSRMPTICAQRLYSLMPDAEILLVIRNQLTAIPSIYINHGSFLKNVPFKYWRKHVSFDEWFNYSLKFINQSYLNSFFYDQFITLFGSVFSRSKIHILLFEDFIHNKPHFIMQLSKILNADVNQVAALLKNKHERPRNTQRQFHYHRLRSFCFYNKSLSAYIPFGDIINKPFQRFLQNSPPMRITLSKETTQTLHALYSEGNKQLAEKFELPLSTYGYPM